MFSALPLPVSVLSLTEPVCRLCERPLARCRRRGRTERRWRGPRQHARVCAPHPTCHSRSVTRRAYDMSAQPCTHARPVKREPILATTPLHCQQGPQPHQHVVVCKPDCERRAFTREGAGGARYPDFKCESDCGGVRTPSPSRPVCVKLATLTRSTPATDAHKQLARQKTLPRRAERRGRGCVTGATESVGVGRAAVGPERTCAVERVLITLIPSRRLWTPNWFKIAKRSFESVSNLLPTKPWAFPRKGGRAQVHPPLPPSLPAESDKKQRVGEGVQGAGVRALSTPTHLTDEV